MVQLAYTQYHAPAFVGMLDAIAPHDINSAAVAEGEAIPMGFPVSNAVTAGGADISYRTCKPFEDTEIGIGISIHAHDRGMKRIGETPYGEPRQGSTTYVATETVNILRKGRCWVAAAADANTLAPWAPILWDEANSNWGAAGAAVNGLMVRLVELHDDLALVEVRPTTA